MRKNKLELLMSLLILLAAWVLSREAAQTAVSADAVKNGAQTFVVVIDAGHGGEDPGAARWKRTSTLPSPCGWSGCCRRRM